MATYMPAIIILTIWVIFVQKTSQPILLLNKIIIIKPKYELSFHKLPLLLQDEWSNETW